MNSEPTTATIECFLGSPWKLRRLTRHHDYPLRTKRLVEAHAERREL
jgi:hypothetical protein